MRPILVILAAALIIGLAYHAWASPNPNQETPLTATQTAKEAISRKQRCATTRVFILAQRLPNGKAVPVMAVVARVPC